MTSRRLTGFSKYAYKPQIPLISARHLVEPTLRELITLSKRAQAIKRRKSPQIYRNHDVAWGHELPGVLVGADGSLPYLSVLCSGGILGQRRIALLL